jgi:hypothetical protein
MYGSLPPAHVRHFSDVGRGSGGRAEAAYCLAAARSFRVARFAHDLVADDIVVVLLFSAGAALRTRRSTGEGV